MTAPLTPSDCDLRDFPFMPLDVMRLRRSRAWLLAKRDPALAFYLINLWSASWHEVPAGSLEDDDLVLADLAMCDADTWERIRDTVLRGWVKCSDGRLYHPVVAEKARDAWQRKQEQRQRTEAARAARAAKRQQATVTSETPPQSSVISTTSSVTEIATDNATTSVTASKGQGQGQYREERKIPSFQDGRDLAPPDLPPDVQKVLWGEGLERLRRLTGKADGPARGILGRLVKAAGDKPAEVLHALRDCPDTGDPVAWLMAACRHRASPHVNRLEQMRHDLDLPTMADPEALAVMDELFAQRRLLQ